MSASKPLSDTKFERACSCRRIRTFSMRNQQLLSVVTALVSVCVVLSLPNRIMVNSFCSFQFRAVARCNSARLVEIIGSELVSV